MRFSFRASIATAAVLFGCGAGQEAKAPNPVADVEAKRKRAEEKVGPTRKAPFTAEEIRAATKPGRTYRYKVEVRKKPPFERVITFTKVDENGAEIFYGEHDPKRMGWVTLQKQSEFPFSQARRREETITIPAGTFDCIVYEVRGEKGEIWTYFFAKALPGAPILFYADIDNIRMKTTTLIEHIPGR